MNENPYTNSDTFAPTTKASSKSELNEAAIAIQWGVFLILSTILSAVAGGILGGTIGGILGVAQYSMGTIQIACLIAGGLVGLPISYACFRWSVKRLIRQIES